jgi:hypothetical protein
MFFDSLEALNRFIDEMKVNSCLNFTSELMTEGQLHFLDVNLSVQENGTIKRGVYVKPTDKGNYVNFDSFLPMSYKISLIKTLVHRAYKITSNWESFDVEMKRITQNLINSNYPISVIEKVMNKTIESLFTGTHTNQKENVNIYYRTFRPIDWEKDKYFLSRVIKQHVLPKEKGKEVKLVLYYKPKKLGNLLHTKVDVAEEEKHGLVYSFNCPEVGCNASYIGYTTNKLLDRISQHKAKLSNIFQHYNKSHRKTPGDDMAKSFKILFMDTDDRNLRMAEALYIKELKPAINKQFNNLALTLHVFN